MLWARVKPAGPVLPMFMFAHFTHHVATGALIPLIPWLRDAFGLDYARSGMLVSAFSLSLGLAQLPVSSLGDRLSKTSMVAVGLLGISLAALAISLSPGFYFVFAFLIVMGLFGATYHAPTSSFLSQWFSQEKRGQALGTHSIGGSVSFVVAPVAAVLIARLAGDWRYSFAALALPALLAGSSIAVAGRRWEKVSLAKLASTPRERFSLVEIARLIGVLLAVALFAGLLVSAFNSFLPLYLVDKHHVPREIAGMFVGLAAGAGILGAPVGGALSDRLGRKRVIVLSVVLSGPSILLLTMIPFGLPMVGAILLGGLIWTSRMPVIESLIADTVPWHRRATVLGVYYFVWQETAGVITPLVGWLIDLSNPNSVFIGLGLAATACSALMLALRGKV
ncbi:MAG: MFS transporter [Chloroflexi bacterium]|nr:MFS transporter [Chloroflexota bacterium]